MPRLDPERVLDLGERASRLSALKEQPAWEELRRIAAERKERQYAILARDLIRGREIDQRRIDRMAGYFDGMDDLLSDPDMAEDKFRRALERAEREKESASDGA